MNNDYAFSMSIVEIDLATDKAIMHSEKILTREIGNISCASLTTTDKGLLALVVEQKDSITHIRQYLLDQSIIQIVEEHKYELEVHQKVHSVASNSNGLLLTTSQEFLSYDQHGFSKGILALNSTIIDHEPIQGAKNRMAYLTANEDGVFIQEVDISNLSVLAVHLLPHVGNVSHGELIYCEKLKKYFVVLNYIEGKYLRNLVLSSRNLNDYDVIYSTSNSSYKGNLNLKSIIVGYNEKILIVEQEVPYWLSKKSNPPYRDVLIKQIEERSFENTKEAKNASSLMANPNPSKTLDDLNFVLRDFNSYKGKACSYTVCDMSGKIMYSSQLKAYMGAITISSRQIHMQSGVYFFSLMFENGEYFSTKFIRQ